MRKQTVVITGASAGVGRAVAHAFAKRGARIGLFARGEEGLRAAAEEVKKLGGDALVCVGDVARPEDLTRAAEETEKQFGPIDVWVNNAMVSVFSPVKEMSAEEFRRVTEVTYLGQVNGTLAALRSMLPRNEGKIIQVGSALAYRSIPLQSAYCAAKHAVQGFTESLRSELLHDGSRVSVTMVDLPAVNTPQFRWVRSRLPRQPQPVPPIFQPEVVAEAIYWAASTRRKRVLVGWPTLEALWAEQVAPAFADEYLALTNYEAQQTEAPTEADRRDNLYDPLPALASTHGDFDDRALPRSKLFWFTRHRNELLAAAALAGGIAVAWKSFGQDERRRSA